MKEIKWFKAQALLFAAFLLLPSSLYAKTAGKVIFVKGQLFAVDGGGKKKILKRRSSFDEGVTLITGPKSRAQVRFVDKALLSLKPNSSLKVSVYRKYDPEKNESDRAVLNLVKGGFRTLTGSIGKDNINAYKVETPAASIGIRGTNYEIAQESRDTFVIGVYEGTIRVENAVGALELGDSANYSYSRIQPSESPLGLLKPPTLLSVVPPLAEDSDSEESSEESNEKTDSEKTDDSEKSEGKNKKDEESADLEGFKQEEKEPPSAETASLESELIEIEIKTEAQAEVAETVLENFQETLDEAVEKVIEESEEAESSENWVDFDNPYLGIPTASTTNSFAAVGITQKEWDLNQAKGIGATVAGAVPEEAFLVTPSAISAFDFSSSSVSFSIQYKIQGQSATSVTINLNTNLTSVQAIVNEFNSQFTSNSAPFEAYLFNEDGVDKMEIAALETDSLFLDHFYISGLTASSAQDNALGNIASFNSGNQAFWRYNSDVDLGLGSLDTNGTAVFFGTDTRDSDNTNFEMAYRRPNPRDICTSLLAALGTGCDVMLTKVGDRTNIAWGYWVLDGTHPAERTDNESGTAVTYQETDGLGFWIAAEPADANQLTGTVSFSASLSCNPFDSMECIGAGYLDDLSTENNRENAYLVKDVTVGFTADFTNNTITNGTLVANGVTDFDQVGETTIAQWNVTFSGDISGSQFDSETVDGNFTSPTMGALNCTSCVTGEVGGLFVDPGDKAVGAFQLRTTGNPGAYEVFGSGIFVTDKQ